MTIPSGAKHLGDSPQSELLSPPSALQGIVICRGSFFTAGSCSAPSLGARFPAGQGAHGLGQSPFPFPHSLFTQTEREWAEGD